MNKNLVDKGEQACNMTLLIKDHKQWNPGSDTPVPSRPVISGNTGLNCHLSEIISHLIDPIAFEHCGNEVDSCDDMLARIEKINEKLASEVVSGTNDAGTVNLDDAEPINTDASEDVKTCEESENLNFQSSFPFKTQIFLRCCAL